MQDAFLSISNSHSAQLKEAVKCFQTTSRGSRGHAVERHACRRDLIRSQRSLSLHSLLFPLATGDPELQGETFQAHISKQRDATAVGSVLFSL